MSCNLTASEIATEKPIKCTFYILLFFFVSPGLYTKLVWFEVGRYLQLKKMVAFLSVKLSKPQREGELVRGKNCHFRQTFP